MKQQKVKEANEMKLPVGMANQLETATAPNKDARPERPPFDDLHARLTKRAYELYLERVTKREGPWKIG